MSTDDRLTRFGQPQRFALSRVQGDGWSLESTTNATDTLSCHCERNGLCTNSGFTLAEVLITLGIIGVVAALTIPTLMQSYKNKQYVSAFQKSWGVLNNMLDLSQAENGFSKTWDIATESWNDVDEPYFEKYFTKYLNITKICGSNTNQGCWAKKTTCLNGEELPFNDSFSQYKLLLNDGMSINLANSRGSNYTEVHATVDTNGPKGPNLAGRDIFKFIIDLQNGKVLPYHKGRESNSLEELKSLCLNETAPDACSAYIVRNGYVMDY